MAAVGASGLRGPAAVNTIIRKFERPYDPDASVRNALARLSEGSARNTGASLPMTGARRGGANPALPSAPQSSTQTPIRQLLLEGLTRGDDIYDIISMLPRAAAQDPASAPVSPQEAATAPWRPNPASASPVQPRTAPTASAEDPGGFMPEFEKRLNRMIADSGGRLRVSSGYRSAKEQEILWQNALKKYGSEEKARKWVAPPGKSVHGKGMAADIRGDLDWAHKNAKRYGLHFPMPWERWHIELLGSRG